MRRALAPTPSPSAVEGARSRSEDSHRNHSGRPGLNHDREVVPNLRPAVWLGRHDRVIVVAVAGQDLFEIGGLWAVLGLVWLGHEDEVEARPGRYVQLACNGCR